MKKTYETLKQVQGDAETVVVNINPPLAQASWLVPSTVVNMLSGGNERDARTNNRLLLSHKKYLCVMLNWFQHPIKKGKNACETLKQVQGDGKIVDIQAETILISKIVHLIQISINK